MIKVLIVEDERPIARAVSRLVDQHPACGVIGMVTNGQAALDILRTQPVDLVITDIQMPVMTGLQLLEIMQKEFPNCLAVVLSGYAQFEYARAALQCRAFDYLLKSVTRDNLFQVLDRVEHEWNRREQAALRLRIDRALAGETVTDDRQFRVVLVQGSVARPLWPCPFHSIRSDQEHILLVESCHWTPDMVQTFYTQLQQNAAVPVHVISSGQTVRLMSLRKKVGELRNSLEQQAVLFRSGRFQENGSSQPSCGMLQKLKPERAVEAIRTQRRGDLLAQMEQMLHTAMQCGALRADVQRYLDAVLSDSRITAQLPSDRRSRVKAAVEELLARAVCPDACARELTNVLAALQNETATKRDLADIVEEIARLLETSYYMHHSAESLAKQYNFVPAYLNKVFKQFKGVRPLEYLLQIRMERAKVMLETMPDVLVKDVAASVGYSDPHYFSNLFKKTIGVWPTEVQQSGHPMG